MGRKIHFKFSQAPSPSEIYYNYTRILSAIDCKYSIIKIHLTLLTPLGLIKKIFKLRVLCV